MEKTKTESNKLIYVALVLIGIVIGWFMHMAFLNNNTNVGGEGTPPPVSLSEISVSDASSETNPAKRAFIGKWEGAWNTSSQLPQYYISAIVAVRGINPNGNADVLYSWGSNETLRLEGGKYEGEGVFAEDGTLIVRLPGRTDNEEGAVVTFRVADTSADTLAGSYQISTQPVSTSVFARVD